MNARLSEICGTCRYWAAEDNPKLERDRTCRLNPPKVFKHGSQYVSRWPMTAESSWCGQWARRGDSDGEARPASGKKDFTQ